MSLENMKKTKPKSKIDFWNDLKNREDFVKNRFFTKNFDWEGESEYRFLTFSRESDDIMLSIKKSLSKVIVGINFSKYYIPSLKEIVPEKKIYGIDFHNFDSNFEIVNLF